MTKGTVRCSQDPAPTVRQREVLSRVGETFTLAELQRSACHRHEGHTRRMLASMLARGAVEATAAGAYRKTVCAVPQCARDAGSQPKRSKRPARAGASTAVPVDRPGIYAVAEGGRAVAVVQGKRRFDRSVIPAIVAAIDDSGPWTVHVVRPGGGRRKSSERINADELLQAARREGKLIEKVVLFTNKTFELSAIENLPPSDAPEAPRPVSLSDFDRRDSELYLGPRGAMALVKTRKGWVVTRRGLHDRLWRIMDGPMRWNQARKAAGDAAASVLTPAPAVGIARPPAGDVGSLGPIGLAARAKVASLSRVVGGFMAAGDSLDLSPWARAPFAATRTTDGWSVRGEDVSAAVLGCMVGVSAEENFEAPEERRDRFDTEWLTHAFRRRGCPDFGPLSKGLWVVDCDGRRTLQLQRTPKGIVWGEVGSPPSRGPFALASELLADVVESLGLDRERPARLAEAKPVDLLALTEQPDAVKPLLEALDATARAFLERLAQGAPQAVPLGVLMDLLGARSVQTISSAVRRIMALARARGLAVPFVAMTIDGERAWRWGG